MSRELALLVVLVFALSVWANLTPNDNALLGAEYLNIGRALAAGRGFADPFGAPTGPTAWMPPVYPFLLAGLILILRDPLAVALAVVLLKNLVLILTGWLVMAAARRHSARLKPAVALAIYGAWLAAHYWWFFKHTHDIWLLLLLIDLTLIGAWFRLPENPTTGRHLLWGLLGGLVFLSSPVAGIAWLSVAVTTARTTRQWGRTGVAVLVALACCGTWVARNSVVFDRLMFVKSNFYFDLYSANYSSPLGVYDEAFFEQHPVWTTDPHRPSAYRELGEVGFNESFRERFRQDFFERPELYFAKVGNRLLAATILYKPYRPDERRPLLRSLVHAAPFGGLVLLLAARRFRLSAAMSVAVLLYAAYLLPYVGVAFYARYLLPLTPVLVLFVFWAADCILSGARPSSSSSPRPS